MEALSSSRVGFESAVSESLSSAYRPTGTGALQPSASVIATHGLQPSVSLEAFVVRMETDNWEGPRSRSRLKRRAPRRAWTPRSMRFVRALLGCEALKSRTAKPGALLR